MIKVTKEERQETLRKARIARDAINEIMGVDELANYYSVERKLAFMDVFLALTEVLEFFPEDPADDPVEEDEA